MFFKYLIVFFISMVPLICAVGNLIPVPIIYFFARKFLIWGLDKPYISGICHFFHDKGEAAGQKLSSSRFGRFGLMAALIVFVGIPVPGTGAWTGTLGASFLDLGMKKTALSVTLGVLIAAIIMATVSNVGFHAIGM